MNYLLDTCVISEVVKPLTDTASHRVVGKRGRRSAISQCDDPGRTAERVPALDLRLLNTWGTSLQ